MIDPDNPFRLAHAGTHRRGAAGSPLRTLGRSAGILAVTAAATGVVLYATDRHRIAAVLQLAQTIDSPSAGNHRNDRDLDLEATRQSIDELLRLRPQSLGAVIEALHSANPSVGQIAAERLTVAIREDLQADASTRTASMSALLAALSQTASTPPTAARQRLLGWLTETLRGQPSPDAALVTAAGRLWSRSLGRPSLDRQPVGLPVTPSEPPGNQPRLVKSNAAAPPSTWTDWPPAGGVTTGSTASPTNQPAAGTPSHYAVAPPTPPVIPPMTLRPLPTVRLRPAPAATITPVAARIELPAEPIIPPAETMTRLAAMTTASVIGHLAGESAALVQEATLELRRRGLNDAQMDWATAWAASDGEQRLRLIEQALAEPQNDWSRWWPLWIGDADRGVRLRAVAAVAGSRDVALRRQLRGHLDREDDAAVATRIRMVLGLR